MENKEIQLQTEIGINHSEVSYAEGIDVPIESSNIFLIEGFRKKERRNINENIIDSFQENLKDLKKGYPEKTILGILQFKKGITKTKEQITNAIKCTLFDGSDGVCIYETNPHQDFESLNQEVNEYLNMARDKQKYFVLEMDGEDLLEKINLLLHKNISNFVLIAGAYNDEDLWRQSIESILKKKGKSIVVFPKRMHPTTKKSYMEKAITYGANVVVHGALFGGSSEQEKKNLFLDSNDMIYKEIEMLPKTNMVFSNEALVNFLGQYGKIHDWEYRASRISSLMEGTIFCEANKRTIILEA